MTSELRTTGRSRPVGSASFSPPWRRCAMRLAALSGAVVLAGCAGMPGAVSPPSTPAPKPPMTVTSNPVSRVSTSIFPTKTPLRFGEKAGFMLSASTEGYGNLYLLAKSGKVLVLAENLRLSANESVLFPPLAGGFNLRAGPPAGVDRVLFLVTRKPFRGFRGAGAGGSQPVPLAVGPNEFIAKLNAAAAELPGSDWALTEARIEVMANGDPRPSGG